MAQIKWNLRIALARQLVDHSFPEYTVESEWATFHDRIKLGEAREQSDLAAYYDDLKGRPEADDIAADANYLRDQVTRTMFAAMVVSMWAEVERNLKFAILALNMFAVKTTKSGGNRKTNYKFWDLDRAFQEFGIQAFKDRAGFDVVNALRIINNKFKHAKGKYAASNADESISPSLIAKWDLLDDFDPNAPASPHAIAFEKIPLAEAVRGCRQFLLSLIDEAERIIAANPPKKEEDDEA